MLTNLEQLFGITRKRYLDSSFRFVAVQVILKNPKLFCSLRRGITYYMNFESKASDFLIHDF